MLIAGDGAGEPTLADREQAIAGNNAAIASEVKRFIKNSEAIEGARRLRTSPGGGNPAARLLRD